MTHVANARVIKEACEALQQTEKDAPTAIRLARVFFIL